MNQNGNNLIYDWNQGGLVDLKGVVHIEFDDETLRDGLQSPSVTYPTIEQKIRILHLMEDLGLHAANIGLPGAGPRAYNEPPNWRRRSSCRMKISRTAPRGPSSPTSIR